MNAAETIAAAIEKLEGLKTEADSSDWGIREVEDERASAGLEPIFEQSGSLVWLHAPGWEADADLILTLHRTIDAQIDALRAAEWLLGQGKNPLNYTHAATASIIRLAEAILGTNN